MTQWTGDPAEFKVYWFARDLVASRFGGFATREIGTLRKLSGILDEMLEAGSNLEAINQCIEDTILNSVNRTYGGDISKRYRQTEDLVERIMRRIDSIEDIRELQIAIDAVVKTGEILDTAPRFGATEIREIVDDTLAGDEGRPDPTLAYDALYNVDFEGESYQLGAQREPLIEYVNELISYLQDRNLPQMEVARIASGTVQEYERRAGQSRASTAGHVLETALDQIFQHFSIPASGSPQHFGDLEIDSVVEGPRRSIGFSCKRTLRERFRQSLSREAEIDVDEVWFVSLMMADVSLDKLRDIKNDGSRIYVPHDSFVWNRYNGNQDLEYTLRPADEFISDIVDFTEVSSSAL